MAAVAAAASVRTTSPPTQMDDVTLVEGLTGLGVEIVPGYASTAGNQDHAVQAMQRAGLLSPLREWTRDLAGGGCNSEMHQHQAESVSTNTVSRPTSKVGKFLAGTHWVVTGVFTTMKRETARAAIEDAGGIVDKNVTPGTTHILIGEEYGPVKVRSLAPCTTVTFVNEPGLYKMFYDANVNPDLNTPAKPKTTGAPSAPGAPARRKVTTRGAGVLRAMSGSPPTQTARRLVFPPRNEATKRTCSWDNDAPTKAARAAVSHWRALEKQDASPRARLMARGAKEEAKEKALAAIVAGIEREEAKK